MQDVITQLRTNSLLKIKDGKQSWTIYICKPNDLICEIEVPHNVLGWFFTVKQSATGKQIYSDWCDYYSETQNEMHASMSADIKRFIEQLLASNIRLVPKKKLFRVLGRSNRLEWEQNGKWQEVSMCPP
jgi:hypothetical protein